jgi:hypothetical protein
MNGWDAQAQAGLAYTLAFITFLGLAVEAVVHAWRRRRR